MGAGMPGGAADGRRGAVSAPKTHALISLPASQTRPACPSPTTFAPMSSTTLRFNSSERHYQIERFERILCAGEPDSIEELGAALREMAAEAEELQAQGFELEQQIDDGAHRGCRAARRGLPEGRCGAALREWATDATQR